MGDRPTSGSEGCEAHIEEDNGYLYESDSDVEQDEGWGADLRGYDLGSANARFSHTDRLKGL